MTGKFSKEYPVVAHPFPTWLPLTMTWAYNQIKYLKFSSSIVLTKKIKNIDQFPWEPLYSFNNKSQYYSYKALRTLRIRTYPSHYDSAIKKNGVLILHSHFGDRGWHDIPIAKNNGLKHVVTFYGYDVSRLPRRQPEWKERYKELFDKADLFLFEGPHMAKCVMALGCPEEKIKVQRLGVEVDKIPFKERELGKDGMINILISGTFNEKKGIPYALEALGMLINEYPNIRITIIGDSAGQERQEQEKKIILDVINKYEMAPLTRMLGFQPHNILMQEAYKHHIFLSPSVTASDGDVEGGAPVTIIEMAASGMPVVSTRHCDIPEIVLDGETGFLAEERDVEDLKKLIKRLVDRPDMWGSMTRKGRQHIEQHYDCHVLGKELSKIYQNLLI